MFTQCFFFINKFSPNRWMGDCGPGRPLSRSIMRSSTTDPPPHLYTSAPGSPVNLDRKFNVPQVDGDGPSGSKGLNTLCVLSAQSRTRSSDITLLRSLKQCSADREYTY